MIKPSEINIMALAALLNLFAGVIHDIPAEMLDEIVYHIYHIIISKLSGEYQHYFYKIIRGLRKESNHSKTLLQTINSHNATSMQPKGGSIDMTSSLIMSIYTTQNIDISHKDSLPYAFAHITKSIIALNASINQNMLTSPPRSASASPVSSPLITQNHDFDDEIIEPKPLQFKVQQCQPEPQPLQKTQNSTPALQSPKSTIQSSKQPIQQKNKIILTKQSIATKPQTPVIAQKKMSQPIQSYNSNSSVKNQPILNKVTKTQSNWQPSSTKKSAQIQATPQKSSQKIQEAALTPPKQSKPVARTPPKKSSSPVMVKPSLQIDNVFMDKLKFQLEQAERKWRRMNTQANQI